MSINDIRYNIIFRDILVQADDDCSVIIGENSAVQTYLTIPDSINSVKPSKQRYFGITLIYDILFHFDFILFFHPFER